MQAAQFSMRGTLSSLSQPKAASSKVRSSRAMMFSPRRAELAPLPRLLPPPNRSLKISPKPPKSPNPPKPPKPAPPAFAAKLGSTPAKPYWSYRDRFSSSDRTS